MDHHRHIVDRLAVGNLFLDRFDGLPQGRRRHGALRIPTTEIHFAGIRGHDHHPTHQLSTLRPTEIAVNRFCRGPNVYADDLFRRSEF